MNNFIHENILYRLEYEQFEDLKQSSNGKLTFESPEQALRWVNWLQEYIGLSPEEVIYEIEQQLECEDLSRQTDGAFDVLISNNFSADNIIKELNIKRALKIALYGIKIQCERCGKPTNYGEVKIIKEYHETGTTSRVISTGLTGGSVTREITHHVIVKDLKVCPQCAEKNRIAIIRSKIKNFLIIVGIVIALAIYILCDIYF